jgi:hypothetical protein
VTFDWNVESVPRKRRQIGTVTSLLWPFGESDLRLLAKKILRHSQNMCSPPNHPDIAHRADFFLLS